MVGERPCWGGECEESNPTGSAEVIDFRCCASSRAFAVPKLLWAIVMRALASDANDRPASAGELYDLVIQVEDD